MPDGSIVFATELDNRELEKDLANAKKKIQSETEKANKASSQKMVFTKQVEELGIALDTAKAKLMALKREQASISSAMSLGAMAGVSVEQYMASRERQPALDAEVAERQKEVDALQKKWDAACDAVQKYDREIISANNTVAQMETYAGKLHQQMAQAAEEADHVGKNSNKSSRAMQEMEKRTRRFNSRLREIVTGALFFNIISRGISLMVGWMGDMIRTNAEARASIAKLKGTLLTLAQPILNVVIPALVTLINIITRVISAIAALVSRLFGTTAQKSAEAAKNLNKQADSYGGVGRAAKDAAKSILAFDELNTLQTQQDTGTGGGAGSLDTIAPDFDFSLADDVAAQIDILTACISGGLLAIGALLAFTGVNIPLGIALMAAGAVGLASVAYLNWDSITTALKGSMGGFVAMMSGYLLAIGLVLAFSGVGMALGISLIAAGAAGLVTVGAVNWDSLPDKLKWVWNEISSWFTSRVQPYLTLQYWQNKFSQIGLAIGGVWEDVKKNAAQKWEEIVSSIIAKINSIIAGINGLISGAVQGVNNVSAALNAISFSVPEWVPGFGGMSFGFNLPTVSAPQIPYLAQGAVIPPNREFLAVLGDQSHGQNIEAPESLIRQIVREEAGDMSSDQLAIIVELIRQILKILGQDIDLRRLAQLITAEQNGMKRARGW